LQTYKRIAQENLCSRSLSKPDANCSKPVPQDVGQDVGGSSDGLQALPLSAVSLGLAPERSGEKTPTGADIALDALLEEDVAHKAKHFLSRIPHGPQ
jgi:hypothetical protein